MTKKKNKKYFPAEKEKLAKLCVKYKRSMTTKKKLKNIVEKKESLLIRALIQRVSFRKL